jgi:hypothetical protein
MAAKITTPHSLRSLVRQVIFAFAIAQNFLPAIFHMRVCFKKRKLSFILNQIILIVSYLNLFWTPLVSIIYF